MKKQLLSLLVCTLFTVGAFAQDLGIKSFTPANQSIIKAGATIGGLVTLEVLDALPANISFSMSYSIDGGKAVVINQQMGFQQAVPAGANITPSQFSFKAPNRTGDTIKLSLFVNLGIDNNRNNDTLTQEYYLADTVPNDIAVSIISPENNSEQKVWTTVPFKVQIKNVGSTTLAQGTPMILLLTVNNQQAGTPQAVNFSEPSLAPGDSATLSVDLPLPRNLFTGPTNICMGFLWAVRNGNTVTTIEGSTGDNLGCVSLNVIANSIDETKIALNALNYNNGQLNIDLDSKGSVGEFKFEVLNITGQQITSSSASGSQYLNHNMILNGLTNGMYLLNMYADGEYIGSEKFMVR